jgi:3-methyladenine DNA glycosylase AlkD
MPRVEREPMSAAEVLAALGAAADPSRLPGMARVGIETSHALGVSVPAIRTIARRAGIDQPLAEALWRTEVHEARMVAALVADPGTIGTRVRQDWARDLDSWDLTDMLADTLAATPDAQRTIRAWTDADHGFTKRCAFAMIARMAVSSAEPDTTFLGWLPLIRAAATDPRNEVKKAVNWALRQIGKRNRTLNRAAVACSQEIQALNNQAARWVASDVQRELLSPAVLMKLAK